MANKTALVQYSGQKAQIQSGDTLVAPTVQSSGNVIASQNFEASTAVAVLGTTGTGTVYLRPSGVASTTGQATLNGGTFTVTGDSVANSYFYSSNTTAVFATTGAGTVYLRPQGAGSTTNQVELTASGNMTVNGNITATGNMSSSQNFISTTAVAIVAATGAGQVILRPNGSGSTSNQMVLNSAGLLSTTSLSGTNSTYGGELNTGQNVNATGTTLVLATTGAGNILLRPNGSGSGTGQVIVDSTGAVTSPATVSSVGGLSSTNPSSAFFNAITATNTSGVQIMMNANGNTEGNIRTTTNHRLSFSTNNTERAAFAAGGEMAFAAITTPGAPANGSIWFDSSTSTFKKRQGGVTTDLGTSTGGSGTVTTVSVVTANGVSASISNPTVNPAMTFTLGNITPTSVSTGMLEASSTTTLNSGSGSNFTISSLLGVGVDHAFQLGAAADTFKFGYAGSYEMTISTSGVDVDTQTAGNNSTKVATTAYVRANVGMANYRVLLDRTGSHTAARVAGAYAIPQGNPCAISGTGTLYSQGVFYFDPADYPSVDGVTAKLRLRGQIFVNDVAPTGNFTIGMYPVTRPGTSGGAGLTIYTIGAATASCTAINTPAADSSNTTTSADFAMPVAGYYVLGVTTTATVAASSHLHINAQLQMRHA